MKASVLMSIYNETEEEIRASVLSVLSQTFRDFELIIVHDNPKSENRTDIIQWLREIDTRIIVVENDINIGLAMSMNKAFAVAKGQYIIRMDSDDICEIYRFEHEIDMLETHRWDLVFSNYTLIDTNGNDIHDGKTAIEIKDQNDPMLSEIIFDGIIHHPTVAMTRDIFIKTGGYRKFPCSQDLDLWLRMLETGCRFLYLNESLLKYRIRDNSITGSNKLKQHLTITYIIHLFATRLRKGHDDYSIAEYEKFISTRINDHKKRHYEKSIQYLQNAIETEEPLQRILLRIKAFCYCPALRYSYIYKKTHKNMFIKKIKKQEKEIITII